MNTFFYIAYIRKDGDAAESTGCLKGEDENREFWHGMLDEFLDNRNNPGNEVNEDVTCFKLCLCAHKE